MSLLASKYEILKKRLDDHGDVDSPLELKYVGQLMFVMSSVGSWPHKQFGRERLHNVLSMYNLLLLFVACVLVVTGAAYLWDKRDEISFSDMGHILLCICLEATCVQRMSLARMDKYCETVKDYLLEFHLFYFKRRSSYVAKIHSQIHIISAVLTLYTICLMTFGITLFTFMPWYNNHSRGMFGDHRPQNSTFEHAAYYYCFTDDVYTTTSGYWMLFAFNVPTTYNTTVGICTFDLLLSLMGLQIWGHLKHLKHILSTIPLPGNSFRGDGMYSAEENITVRQLLKEIVIYHDFIIKFVNRCSETFSEYLFVFYFTMQLTTCILLLQVQTFTTDALAKYGPLTMGIFELLIQVSILFEMINTKSEQLIDAVYAMPWECMDACNRRTVMFLLHRVQSPVTLKAAKMVPVGVMTMSAVLKTSLSYYMMLNAARER